MATLIELGRLSPTMEEGVLSKWRKNEGEKVTPGEVLAEVETDKAAMEMESFDEGTLLRRLVREGTTLKVGAPVAILGKPGEDVAGLEKQATEKLAALATGAAAVPAAGPAPAAGPGLGLPEPRSTTTMRDSAESKSAGGSRPPYGRGAEGASTAAAQPAREGALPAQAPGPAPAARPSAFVPTGFVAPAGLRAVPSGRERVLASPVARKMAAEKGVDLGAVAGTGPQGRVVKRDVEGAPAAAAPAAAAAPRPAPPEIRPLSMMRRTIARRMVDAWKGVPHFYLRMEIDFDAAHAFREKANADLAGVAKLSFNDMVIKACALALRERPECNASFDGERILVHPNVDIGVAVALDEGLITPVVRDADKKSLSEISTEIRSLAARAREKKLKPEEYTGGTFTISNLGMFGVDEFDAVINPPEAAILAVGAVMERPVVREGQMVIGRTARCTLSCDHRVIDGATGARLLGVVRELLEHPMRLVL